MIAPDKLGHLIAGVGIAIFFSLILRDPAFAFILAWIIGWAKEKVDRTDPENHTYDPKDARFTMYGGAIGSLISVVVLHWLGWLGGYAS